RGQKALEAAAEVEGEGVQRDFEEASDRTKEARRPAGRRRAVEQLDRPFVPEPARPGDGAIGGKLVAELVEGDLRAARALLPPIAQHARLHPAVEPAEDDDAAQKAQRHARQRTEAEHDADENAPCPTEEPGQPSLAAPGVAR